MKVSQTVLLIPGHCMYNLENNNTSYYFLQNLIDHKSHALEEN